MESRKVCFYFLQNRCTFGAKCLYLHERPEQPAGVNCLLIRHGQSGYNFRLDQCVTKHGSDAPTSSIGKEDFQLDCSLIDSPLTQEGVRQASLLKKQVLGSQVQLVFVSPLERALQTAQLIFGDHQVRFIVIPALAQIFSKVCDIASSIDGKRRRYPHMDFSLLDGKEMDWQTTFLQPPLKQGFEKCLTTDREQSEALVASFYLNHIKNNFPDSIERREDCSKRVQEGTKFIKKFCKDRYKNVAVVSHRRVLREITSTPYNPKGYGFENCELVKHLL